MQPSARISLVLTLLLALALRGGIAVWKSPELTEDRDAYLGIAASVAEGRGYSSPGSTQPTAYRPPLYPLLLAIGPPGHIAIWVATVNLLAGAGTVMLTYLIGRRLNLSEAMSVAAAALVAIDPLLVRYASQPMTESVCTLLVTAWLWQTLRLLAIPTVCGGLLGGVLFGLAALCRPTVWVAGGLVGCWVLWLGWRGRLPLGRCHETGDADAAVGASGESRLSGGAKWGWRPVAAAAIGCLAVVLPWPIRNYYAMGRPILTTTHGGYTLLLGNNVVFFHEFARHPYQSATTLRTSTAHADWMLQEQRWMLDAGVRGEIDEDRWMSQRAWEHIGQDPLGFIAACALRESWFWNIVPLRASRAGWQGFLIQGVGTFYAVTWVYCLAALFVILAQRRDTWIPGLLVIVAFASVHLLYWSNARMRAPMVPILALLAVRGFCAIVLVIRPTNTAPTEAA